MTTTTTTASTKAATVWAVAAPATADAGPTYWTNSNTRSWVPLSPPTESGVGIRTWSTKKAADAAYRLWAGGGMRGGIEAVRLTAEQAAIVAGADTAEVPPGGLTADSPGQTERVAAAHTKAAAVVAAIDELAADESADIIDAEVVMTAEALTLARELDAEIRALARQAHIVLEALIALVNEAQASGIHVALGFPSWTAYLADALDGQWAVEKERRGEVVRYLGDQGMSVRAIAAVTGAGRGTVHRELAGVPLGQVMGLDGKTYPSRKPAKKPTMSAEDKAAAREARISMETRLAAHRLEAEQARQAYRAQQEAIDRRQRAGVATDHPPVDLDDDMPATSEQVEASHIMARAKSMAASVDGIAGRLEALFAAAAGAGIASEVEALLWEPFQRVCNVMEDTTAPAAEG